MSPAHTFSRNAARSHSSSNFIASMNRSHSFKVSPFREFSQFQCEIETKRAQCISKLFSLFAPWPRDGPQSNKPILRIPDTTTRVVLRILALNGFKQPGPRKRPKLVYGAGRNPQYFGRLIPR